MTTENVFDSVHPSDGYRVTKITNSLSLSLYVGLQSEGEIVAIDGDGDCKVWEKRLPDYSCGDYGAFSRLEDVLSALCRYFNASGDWDELDRLLAEARNAFKGPLVFEDWVYYEGYVDTEGYYTHVWKREDSSQVVRWVVGAFVDTALLLDDLLTEELAEQEDSKTLRDELV